MPLDSLEYVVRPYQTPGPHGTILIPSTPKNTRERATLTWGAKTEMPVPDTGVNVTCCSEGLKEKTRSAKRIRVYQNDDENSPNWVDVERPETMSLNKKEKNDCISDWEQISGVAQAISGTFDQDLIQMGDPSESDGGTCGVNWTFKNV
jgi:hypothetical protein